MFAPEQHDLYDGHHVLSANRIHMVGGLNDPVGWDHLDNEAKAVKPVSGTAEIDVNDLTNTGKFEARLKIPEGDWCSRSTSSTNSTHARTAGSLASSTSTERIRAAATTTGRRRSCTWRVGASATPPERQAAVRQLRNALHGHAGHPQSEDAPRQLPDGQQEDRLVK
jgi:hypothetical protein